MGGTHKRNMRAEKAKVKLKGAKLPKGLNVTKTDFKVRKIMIREQLTESQYGIDGQRQFNLKETLSRLKHHNTNFRTDALRNLRESLAHGTATHLLGHLNELIQGISACSLDLEREVRRESYKTLGALLAALQAASVAPFFHVISSYLRCAMTHIQTAVQEDSLLMLDVLLQHVPMLLTADSAKIFRNFLEMISRVRADGDRANRTLTVHMGQQQTTIKWRTKVLLRLQKMFATLVEEQRRSNEENSNAFECIIATHNAKAVQHFSLKRNYGLSSVLTELFRRNIVGTTDDGTNDGGYAAAQAMQHLTNDDSQILRHYVEHLMPLLLETWLEVRPEINDDNNLNQMLLSHDDAYCLNIVLQIINNLWIFIDNYETKSNTNELSVWLRNEYGVAFNAAFFGSSAGNGGSYPYRQQPTKAKIAKRTKENNDNVVVGGENCLPQNMYLAQLYNRFFNNNNNENSRQQQHYDTLLKYLLTIVVNLESQQVVPVEYQHQLVATLRTFLLNNNKKASTSPEHERELRRDILKAINNAFLQGHFTKRDGNASSKVLVLLCEIVQHPKLYTEYGGDAAFNDFLVYLPQLLLKSAISETALLSMSQLGKQRNKIFLQNLAPLIGAVLENIQSIQVNGACNAFEGKKHIMNLFYWVTERDDWHLEQLHKLLETHVTDKRIISYFSFILKS